MHPNQQMHQELLCNGFGLPGMPQQPMQSHPQYQHASLDPSLAANMAHLGLGQCSIMDNLQGATWHVRITLPDLKPKHSPETVSKMLCIAMLMLSERLALAGTSQDAAHKWYTANMTDASLLRDS